MSSESTATGPKYTALPLVQVDLRVSFNPLVPLDPTAVAHVRDVLSTSYPEALTPGAFEPGPGLPPDIDTTLGRLDAVRCLALGKADQEAVAVLQPGTVTARWLRRDLQSDYHRDGGYADLLLRLERLVALVGSDFEAIAVQMRYISLVPAEGRPVLWFLSGVPSYMDDAHLEAFRDYHIRFGAPQSVDAAIHVSPALNESDRAYSLATTAAAFVGEGETWNEKAHLCHSFLARMFDRAITPEASEEWGRC